jgi:hypothetical protein
MSSADDEDEKKRKKKKRTDEETLDAVFDEAELDEHVDAIAKMSPEEVARELARAGVDVEAARAHARRQLEGGKVIPLARRRRAALWAVGAAAAAAVVFAVLWTTRDSDIVAKPAPDAADADADDAADASLPP